MEKRRLIPLSLMLLCSLCFSTACNNTETTPKNVIATIGTKKITADNLYNATLYNEATAKYVYDILERALIESSIPVSKSMRTKVENEVEKWRATIEANSKLNSTDYEEDLKTELEAEGANSLEELINNKIYKLRLEYAEKQFLEAKQDEYHNMYIDNNYLYHVNDMLLTMSGSISNKDVYADTISSTEAQKLYDAFTELFEGERFYSVAEKYSGGETASNGGDLGVVNLDDTDINNELRYALIGYSSIIENKYNDFNLPENAYTNTLKDIYASGLQSIPYSYIKGLNDVYSTSSSGDSKNLDTNNNFYYSSGSTNDLSLTTSKTYYRNIIFNVLFNSITPRFITVTEDELKEGVNATKMEVLVPNENSQGYASEKQERYVLTNELGNPYVVYKDEKGIHVLSINKTPFDSNLHEYYTNSPSETDQIVSYAEFGKNKEQRVEEMESLAKNYITRNYAGNTGDDRLFSFEMFKFYLNKSNNGGFAIVDDNVKKMIEQYMASVSVSVDENRELKFGEYYNKYSNLVWHSNQSYIIQERPLLSCLIKGDDNNYGCIYVTGEGFKHYAPASGGEEQ